MKRVERKNIIQKKKIQFLSTIDQNNYLMDNLSIIFKKSHL